MAKFNTRHKRQGGSSYLLKIIGALIGAGLLVYVLWLLLSYDEQRDETKEEQKIELQMKDRSKDTPAPE